MINKTIEKFHWSDFNSLNNETLTDKEKYQLLIDWAGVARGTNPKLFDDLTEWILDDSEWTEEKLTENEKLLMQGVIDRFKKQNATLKEHLTLLNKSPKIVNKAIFTALDNFDHALSGKLDDLQLKDTDFEEAVSKMLADFSVMKARDIRLQIAGEKTGAVGTDGVNLFGYINLLKDLDAGVQWALFMPQAVERQQSGFRVETFEYKTLPALRFIGVEADISNWFSKEDLQKIFSDLDNMSEYKSDFNYDILLEHHYGKCVDKERWHGFFGRFMKENTPVPDGFLHFDFLPDDTNTPYLTFRSQFAFATFSGDIQAMHKREGYDSSAMYDVTRNIILGQCVLIPYPDIYWTAEVFLNGYQNPSTAYMFSAIL